MPTDPKILAYQKERRARLRSERGVPPIGDYDHLFVKQGEELRAMMNGEFDFMLADDTRDRTPMSTKVAKGDKACVCGCGQFHNNSVSKLTGDHNTRRILWFRSGMCRAKWEKSNVV